jgi:hypothetical protein
MRFKNYLPWEVLSYLSIVERTEAHSIRFTGKNMISYWSYDLRALAGAFVLLSPDILGL